MGRVGWYLHCELPYLKTSGNLLFYLKFEFSEEEKGSDIYIYIKMYKCSIPGSIFTCKIMIDTLR